MVNLSGDGFEVLSFSLIVLTSNNLDCVLCAWIHVNVVIALESLDPGSNNFLTVIALLEIFNQKIIDAFKVVQRTPLHSDFV